MNTIKKCLTCIAAVILICVFVTGTVSAYDADTACQSANEIISSTNNTTALELVGFYSDYSLRQFKIWTEYFIDPDLCGQIRQFIEERDPGQELSEMILTTVSGEERVWYKLSPETSLFVKLPESVDFPDQKKYADKMMLYFKIIGYHGKDTVIKNASSLNPENMFGSRNGITPAAVLADLFGREETKTSASSLLTTASLHPGGAFDAQISHVSSVNTVTSANRLNVRAGQGDFASVGSELIDNYRQG